jgi:hypothetical protein
MAQRARGQKGRALGAGRFFVSSSARLRGGGVRQTVSLAPVDFIAADGTALDSTALDGWRDVYVLSLHVYAEPGCS